MSNRLQLRVYYYSIDGRYRERVYEDGGQDGAVLP